MFEGAVLLRNVIQKDPLGPINWLANFFGFFLNIIFNMVNSIMPTEAHTLGISIIIFTCFVRIVMLPLAFKSQKSMAAMQKLQPEMEKIKAKYGDSKDPEDQRKMSMEIQGLYSKHKANPLMGCLPLFIQMPIFMAMYYIMNQPYKFIDSLGKIYINLAEKVIAVPNSADILIEMGSSKVPEGISIFVEEPESLVKLLNKFVEADWTLFLSKIPTEFVGGIQDILNTKVNIEQIFSISLTENTGLYWPAIVIPIISVIATFLSSYLSNKQNKSTDPNMVMQQKVMMFAMPVMMGFFTMNIPGGVGLYWITSNTFQVIQQVVMQKFTNKDIPADDIIDEKKEKTKKSIKEK